MTPTLPDLKFHADPRLFLPYKGPYHITLFPCFFSDHFLREHEVITMKSFNQFPSQSLDLPLGWCEDKTITMTYFHLFSSKLLYPSMKLLHYYGNKGRQQWHSKSHKQQLPSTLFNHNLRSVLSTIAPGRLPLFLLPKYFKWLFSNYLNLKNFRLVILIIQLCEQCYCYGR